MDAHELKRLLFCDGYRLSDARKCNENGRALLMSVWSRFVEGKLLSIEVVHTANAAKILSVREL